MTARDRADDLRVLPDLWPEIQLRLQVAASMAQDAMCWYAWDLDDYDGPAMRSRLEAKFRAGEAEHGRDWLGMTREQLDEEIRNELRDLVLYHAMILTRWGVDAPTVTVPPFTTNSDPGDEQDNPS